MYHPSNFDLTSRNRLGRRILRVLSERDFMIINILHERILNSTHHSAQVRSLLWVIQQLRHSLRR